MNQITLSLALSCMALLALTTSCKKDAGPTDISNQFTVSTIAGNGIKGSVDGPASSSQFYSPTNIVADAQGNVYVSDNSKHSIRRISKDGTVNTLAGGTKGTADGKGASAQFISVGPLALDGQRRAEHERGRAKPPHHLQPDHGLARPGRGDDEGLVTPGGAVRLERLQAQRLVAPPLPGELPRGERRRLGRHHTRVREAPDASVASGPAA